MSTLRQLLEIPWGDVGLPELFAEPPLGGLAPPRPPRPVRAPVRLRATGEVVDLLAAAPLAGDGPTMVVRYAASGQALLRFRLTPPTAGPEQWRIVDFAVDSTGGIILLEDLVAAGEQRTVLRRLAADGTEVWCRSGRFSQRLDLDRLQGDFPRLLGGDSAVYLPATRHRGMVARIDFQTGGLEPFAEWGDWTGEVFLAPDGALGFVRWRAAERRCIWCRLDPASGRETQVVMGEEASRLLGAPFGVDAAGRVYALESMGAARIDPKDEIERLTPFEGIALDPAKRRLLSSHDRGDALEIDTWGPTGRREGRVVLNLPVSGEGVAGPARLLRRDEEGRYLVGRGGAPGSEEQILVFDAAGNLESMAPPPATLSREEYRLQAATTWRVVPAGGVYLPVLGPAAFHLLCIDAGPPDEAGEDKNVRHPRRGSEAASGCPQGEGQGPGSGRGLPDNGTPWLPQSHRGTRGCVPRCCWMPSDIRVAMGEISSEFRR